MVKRILKFCSVGLGVATLATVCFAAGSVASVTSAQPFAVDGVTLSNPGVNSWPLITSDEITTTAGSALVTFQDGSAIKLSPQSRVRLAGTTTSPQVILIAGRLDTKLAPGSRLLVTHATATGAADDTAGSGAASDDDIAANTGARPNNNTQFRKAALLYFVTGVTLAGLGLAVDAILQPAAVSPQ